MQAERTLADVTARRDRTPRDGSILPSRAVFDRGGAAPRRRASRRACGPAGPTRRGVPGTAAALLVS